MTACKTFPSTFSDSMVSNVILARRNNQNKGLCKFKYQESIVSNADESTDLTIISNSLKWKDSVQTNGSIFACSDILRWSFYPGTANTFMLADDI